jgi:ribosomal protein S18 acetylase RimI-like enzyme
MHHAFPTNPMFKGVWAPRLTADELHAAAEEALSWHRARESPYVFWWAGPSAEPAGLGQAIQHHGFEPYELDAPGQVADLAQLDWGSLARAPAGFRADRVDDQRELETFARTFVEAFEIPEWAGQAWVEATRTFGIGEAPWQQYIGWLDGRPVSTTMLFFGAGVATVFAIGTVPDARGQGIGAAITLHGLAEARERGYRYAVLFATERGAPIYRRIGFRDAADATISRWLWRSETAEALRPGR